MQVSFVILGFFILGLGTGMLELFPFLNEHDPSLPALWILMLLVGLSLGTDKKLSQILSALRPKILLLPFATTTGTFAGCIFAALFLPWTIANCLAVGSGFGYYSLSSVFITQYTGSELGTIALLANIMREIFTLLFALPVYKLSGPVALISCGGCTTMDTTLPIITRAAGSEWVLPAIAHAMALDISVPFWVTLFCTIRL